MSACGDFCGWCGFCTSREDAEIIVPCMTCHAPVFFEAQDEIEELVTCPDCQERARQSVSFIVHADVQEPPF